MDHGITHKSFSSEKDSLELGPGKDNTEKHQLVQIFSNPSHAKHKHLENKQYFEAGSDIVENNILDRGVDLPDTDNSKTALYIIQLLEEEHDEVPVFAPGTNVDRNGKTPSGQSGEALVISISHV